MQNIWKVLAKKQVLRGESSLSNTNTTMLLKVGGFGQYLCCQFEGVLTNNNVLVIGNGQM